MKSGKTIYLSKEEARLLLDALDDHEINNVLETNLEGQDDYPEEKLNMKLCRKLHKIISSPRDN